MKSGMLAAQATFSALTAAAPQHASSSRQQPVDLSSYQTAMEESYVWDELRDSRNIRPGYVADLCWCTVAHWSCTVVPCPHGPALSDVPGPALPCPCHALPCPPMPPALLCFALPSHAPWPALLPSALHTSAYPQTPPSHAFPYICVSDASRDSSDVNTT